MTKKILISVVLLFSYNLFSQNIKGQWNLTERQVSNMNVNQDLIGTWISSINDPYLSFKLNSDKSLIWLNDSLNFDLPDSLFWTKPMVRWTVKGDEFYIFTPAGQEKNKWNYTILGAYYLKKNKLYIGNCFDNADDLKNFIKQKIWKEKKDACAHELINRN